MVVSVVRRRNNMELIACDKCRVYLPYYKILSVWNDRKEKTQHLCKNCCIELCVDAEYINRFDENGNVIE